MFCVPRHIIAPPDERRASANASVGALVTLQTMCKLGANLAQTNNTLPDKLIAPPLATKVGAFLASARDCDAPHSRPAQVRAKVAIGAQWPSRTWQLFTIGAWDFIAELLLLFARRWLLAGAHNL